MANQLRSTGEYLPMNLPPRPTGYSIRPLTLSVRIPGRRGLRMLVGIRMISTVGNSVEGGTHSLPVSKVVSEVSRLTAPKRMSTFRGSNRYTMRRLFQTQKWEVQ